MTTILYTHPICIEHKAGPNHPENPERLIAVNAVLGTKEFAKLERREATLGEREEAAQSCSLDLHITLPVLVEEMDNVIDEGYGAAPERLYLIGADGLVAYHGGAGPYFFDLDEWEQAIEVCARKAKVTS